MKKTTTKLNRKSKSKKKPKEEDEVPAGARISIQNIANSAGKAMADSIATEFIERNQGYDFSDNINHPKHYNAGNIESIEFIHDQGQSEGFCKGNALKYISRAGRKAGSSEIEDLKKAVWYLQYYIETLEAKKEGRKPCRPNDLNKKVKS